MSAYSVIPTRICVPNCKRRTYHRIMIRSVLNTMPKNPKRRAVSSRSPFVLHIAGVFTSPLRLLHRLAYALPPHPSPRGAHCGRLSPCSGPGCAAFFALAGDRGVPPFFWHSPREQPTTDTTQRAAIRCLLGRARGSPLVHVLRHVR